VHSLQLGTGAPISFTAGVSPESEFVRLEFYCRDESQPFLTADNIKVDMRWYQDTNAVARVVTRPKDEYKLILETKVADPDDPSDPDTPGHDCPGYVVVEGARGIYHGPMRYYPKDGWVRLRPVANPGYRFVKWETSENVTGAVLFFGIPFMETGINEIAEERIAVRMDDDTTLRAVFEPHITLQFGLSEGGPYKDVDPPDLRSIEWDEDYELVSDNTPVWIGALANDIIWFRVPELENCGDSVIWAGQASGTGWCTSVPFNETGEFSVTATFRGITKTARLIILKKPPLSRKNIALKSFSHGKSAYTAWQWKGYAQEWSRHALLGGGYPQGRSNACCHAYWNALLSYVFGPTLAFDVTEAHEHDGLYIPDPERPLQTHNSAVMDLLNNWRGVWIADDLKKGGSRDAYELRNAVIDALNEGSLWMLSTPEAYDDPLSLLLKTDQVTGDNIPTSKEPPYFQGKRDEPDVSDP